MSSKKKLKDVTDKFQSRFQIKDIKFTEKQRNLIKILRDQDTKVVFVAGPAGTSKSFLTIFGGLMALRSGEKDKIKYIRAAVESSDAKLGFLPGSSEDKIGAFCMALYDKLEELLSREDADKLLAERAIEILSPNFLRGVTFTNSFVIVDECQDMTYKSLVTTISRIGNNSTIVFCYDPVQTDIRNSGIEKFAKVFSDKESEDNGIHVFKFNKEDIMRSEILKFIMGKLENSNNASQA